MALRISTATDVTPEQLRSLIVEALSSLLGAGARLWDGMPALDEQCLGVLDAQDDLTLLSFDASDAQGALMKGLACMEQLSGEQAARLLRDYRRPSRLLVLSPSPPPGMEVLVRCHAAAWNALRVLRVNGELGLLIEPKGEASNGMSVAFVHSTFRGTEPERAGEDAKEPALTAEEEDFFQQA